MCPALVLTKVNGLCCGLALLLLLGSTVVAGALGPWEARAGGWHRGGWCCAGAEWHRGGQGGRVVQGRGWLLQHCRMGGPNPGSSDGRPNVHRQQQAVPASLRPCARLSTHSQHRPAHLLLCLIAAASGRQSASACPGPGCGCGCACCASPRPPGSAPAPCPCCATCCATCCGKGRAWAPACRWCGDAAASAAAGGASRRRPAPPQRAHLFLSRLSLSSRGLPSRGSLSLLSPSRSLGRSRSRSLSRLSRSLRVVRRRSPRCLASSRGRGGAARGPSSAAAQRRTFPSRGRDRDRARAVGPCGAHALPAPCRRPCPCRAPGGASCGLWD
jgi:hypothetical protein